MLSLDERQKPAVRYRVRCHIVTRAKLGESLVLEPLLVVDICIINGGVHMKRPISIKSLVTASLLIALSVILSRFLSIQLGQTVRIGFGKLPIILAGVFLGPWWGLAVGGLSDFMGFFVNPMGGAFIPGITLSAALCGFLPGLWVHGVMRNRKLATIALATVVNGLFVDLMLTGLWLTLAFGKHTYPAMLWLRLPNVAVMMVVNTTLVYAIVKSAEQIFRLRVPAVE